MFVSISNVAPLAAPLKLKRVTPVGERVVYVQAEPEEVPEPSPVEPPSISHRALFDQLFERGLDGLPDAPVEEAPALPADSGASYWLSLIE